MDNLSLCFKPIQKEGDCACNETPVLPECPIIQLKQGKLQGKSCLDKNKRLFYSFLSVPYAKAPVGKLRFMPPEPAEPWSDVLDATKDMPMSVQHVGLTKEIIGQEDCLYLNVHSPEAVPIDDILKPVMVYFHCGGFLVFSGNTDWYGAEFLMTQDVILVTVNYRLGTLGFASSSDNSIGVYGNMGLKDQNMALKWVRDNIIKFGGNADNVTIFGNGAGGASVNYHVLSPMSKGLFHRAFSMSGYALSAWCNGRKGTLEIKAKQLHINTKCKKDMLLKLQELPVEQIMETQETHRLLTPIQEVNYYAPVVETQTKPEAFLPASPSDIYKSGKYSHVPYILGYTINDGLFMEIFPLLNSGQPYILKDMMYVMPNDLNMRVEDKSVVHDKVKKFYFGKEEPSADNINKFVDLVTDVWYSNPLAKTIRAHIQNNDRIYLYKFIADTKLNFFKNLVPETKKFEGASSIDDLGYIFKMKFTPRIKAESVEDKAIDMVVSLWTNFARFGKPTNLNSTVKWLPVTKLRKFYLEIGSEELKLLEDPDKDRVQFWNDIYTNYDKIVLKSSCICAKPIIVQTPNGKLRGKVCKDRNNNPFYTFLKVPYAKPPTGKRRFMAPQPITKWCGIYNTNVDDLPYAIQQVALTKIIQGQEDCLYLNVHTPQLPNDNDLPRPVMVYFHGGSYVEGTGRSEYLGAEFLMPHGVVLVTANYRLGILGFASSTDNSIRVPGNMGLKDQNMVLKWTNKNIHCFGGDPCNVTIFGNGAGAASVHLHMLSPMSRCLFHKVFALSASALCTWNIGIKGTLEKLAEKLNIPINNRKEMLIQLQNLPIDSLMGVIEKSPWLVPIDEPYEYGPVIETQTKYPSFLPAAPLDILQSGNYSHVQLLIGHTNLEGVYLELIPKLYTGKAHIFTKDFKRAIPCDLNVHVDERAAVAQKIKDFYYGREAPSVKNIRKFTNLAADLWFTNGIKNAIKEHVQNGDHVYFYKFVADTSLNYLKRLHRDTKNISGASHLDDLGYIFKTPHTPKFEYGTLEDKAINRILTLWTNFAKFGSPTNYDSPVQWPRATVDKLHFMEIGTEGLTPGIDTDTEGFKFWEELYNKINLINSIIEEI